MVSEAELVERLRDFIRSSDLSTTTAAIIRRRLEEDFGVDLSEKKVFIREQIDIFLGELHENEEEVKREGGEGVEVKAEEEEEEEPESGGGEEDEEEEADEEDGGEEEGSSNGGSGSKKRSSKKLTTEVKKKGGGFTKICSLSPQLQEFVSVPELARTEVVKRLWAYIRENNLQDPSDKRKIICDERLQSLFKVNTINMFQMNKALSKHIWPLSENGPVESARKEKPQKKMREDLDDTSRKGKRQKGGTSGFLIPIPLSDGLTKFIGTGENALPRSDVVKRLWDYIKKNNLQDPADRRNVICDDKLKELLQVDSFSCFTVAKLLTAHFMKRKKE